MKVEALDHTLWRTRSGREYGPVVRRLRNDDEYTWKCVDNLC